MKNFILILIALGFVIQSYGQKIDLDYPFIESVPAQEIYFHISVKDEYRNIENIADGQIIEWFKKQQDLANNTLEQISNRNKLFNKLLEYSSRKSHSVFANKIIGDGTNFSLKRKKNENVSKLYYRLVSSEVEVELYDPASFSNDLENLVISDFQPSWDGKYVVVAITHSGKEIADLVIVETATGEVLPEIVPGARPDSFLGVSWLPDNSGFTFLQFSEDSKIGNYSVLYKLGANPENIQKVFGFNLHNNIEIPQEGVYPIAKILKQSDKFVLGYLATVENFWNVYISPMEDFKEGNPKWEKFYGISDSVFTSDGVFYEDDFIFKGNRNNDRNALYKVNIDDSAFAKAEEMVKPPLGEILKDFIVKPDAIYYTTTKNGVESFLYSYKDGCINKITLPKPAGKINLSDDPRSKALYVSISGWTSKNQRYIVDTGTNSFQLAPLSSQVEFPEFGKIVSKEVEVLSEDGVTIPLSIIYRSDIKLDKSNPTLFYSYGAYGTSIEPFYSSTFLHWVEMGGVLCVPHVRGGGEKGEQWHKDGMMSKKKNTWFDLITCTEYMIDNNYTSPKKIAIYSMSAGGIMVGRAITERPDLYAAAIAEVAILNPIRSEFRVGAGGSNMLEYGSIKIEKEIDGLIAMDPYLNLEKGTSYPGILLTAGKNDPRVPLWMPGKFLAKAQNYSTSRRPVIMRIDDAAGHGSLSEKQRYYQEYADVFSFALWQMGHKDYQLTTD